MTTASVAVRADRASSRLVVSIACGVYLAGYAGYCFVDTLGVLRYLVYAVPFLLLASLLVQRTPAVNASAVAYLFGYLVLALVSYASGMRDEAFVSRNVVIIAMIIACFIPVIDVGEAQIRAVFHCSLLCLLIAWAVAESRDIRLLQILVSGTGSAFEAGYDDDQGGLLGPIYAVFFYAIGAKLQFLLALAMSLIGGKRVGVVAIVAGLVAAAIFRRVAGLGSRRHRFGALLVVLVAINLVGSNLASITEYGCRLLNIEVSIEEVMLGRHAISSEMERAMAARPLVETLFGSGPGSADALATLVSGGTLEEPHNDWMKISLDYGLVGSLVITVFMALVFSTSATAAVVAVASATMMSTDNTFVYLFYQIPVALMVAWSARQRHLPPRGPDGRFSSAATFWLR